MKLPAVALAVAFAGGILFGRLLLRAGFRSHLLLLFTAVLLALPDKLWPAAAHTDQNGAVQLVTDGHSLRVNCFLACREEVAASGNVHAPDHQQSDEQKQKAQPCLVFVIFPVLRPGKRTFRRAGFFGCR